MPKHFNLDALREQLAFVDKNIADLTHEMSCCVEDSPRHEVFKRQREQMQAVRDTLFALGNLISAFQGLLNRV